MIRIFEKSRNKSKEYIDHRFKRLAQPRIIGSPIEPFLDSFIGDFKPLSSNIIPSSYNDCKQLNIFNIFFDFHHRARVNIMYIYFPNCIKLLSSVFLIYFDLWTSLSNYRKPPPYTQTTLLHYFTSCENEIWKKEEN